MPAMLGTETGESVWIPASFNGVATIGRIPNRSALPVNTTFDTVEPMSRDVRAQFGHVAGEESGASTS